MFVIEGFLNEGGEELVLFGHMEVVILGLAEVVMVSLGLVEVVMIIKTLNMMLAMYVHRVFVKDNKDEKVDDNKPYHFELIT